LTKLVYIGGYGQSGSTLLEILITTNPNAVACGEIVNGLRKRSGKMLTCSCGSLARDCPIWSVFNEIPIGLQHHEGLVITLLRHADGKYAIMSDSSKTTWGTITAPFRLRRRLEQDFCLVHLVRDPRAVCWSAIRLAQRDAQRKKTRKNSRLTKRVLSKPILRCLRTSIGWWVANISCELFGWLYSSQYLRIHYEHIACSPHIGLRELFGLVSPGVMLRFTEIGASDNRHQIYGNRLIRQRLLLSDVRLDDRWKFEMASGYRCLAGALTWPLRRRYGY
jgi:hypothetical protein